MMSCSATINDRPNKDNLNEHWKNIDAIFQTQLRQYVISENKDKFNALSKELGFNDIEKEFLFDSIQTFIKQYTFRHRSLTPNIPFQATSLYAIPNNKNENISTLKRKRSDDLISDDFDESDSTTDHDDDNNNNNKRKKKKRRTNSKKADENTEEEDVEELWQKDEDLTAGEQEKLEEEGVYVIECINNHRKISNTKYEYNVSWVGYSDKTWEPPHHINPSLIHTYWKKKGYKIDPKGAMLHLNNKKKRKKNKKKEDEEHDDVEELWGKDANLTAREQQKLEEEGVYVIECIINHRKISNNKYEYNVSWIGYSDKTWEPPHHINPSLIRTYWKKKGYKVDPNGAMIHLNNKNNKKNGKKKRKKKLKRKRKKEEDEEQDALCGHKTKKHPKNVNNKGNKRDVVVYWEDSEEDERELLIIHDHDDD